MVRKIFAGDKVRTTVGVGIVEDACSWYEKIEGMNDVEAREFSGRCFVDIGRKYKTQWVEVFVDVGGKRHRFLGHQVEVLEGRDAY